MTTNNNNEEDLYENVAVIYAIFLCDSCGEVYSPEMNNMESDNTYKIMGEKAKDKGWYVDKKNEEYFVLCPSCKNNNNV